MVSQGPGLSLPAFPHTPPSPWLGGVRGSPGGAKPIGVRGEAEWAHPGSLVATRLLATELSKHSHAWAGVAFGGEGLHPAPSGHLRSSPVSGPAYSPMCPLHPEPPCCSPFLQTGQATGLQR